MSYIQDFINESNNLENEQLKYKAPSLKRKDLLKQSDDNKEQCDESWDNLAKALHQVNGNPGQKLKAKVNHQTDSEIIEESIESKTDVFDEISNKIDSLDEACCEEDNKEPITEAKSEKMVNLFDYIDGNGDEDLVENLNPETEFKYDEDMAKEFGL